MPRMNAWQSWLAGHVADTTTRAIARRTGDDNKSVGRWLDAERPPAEFVIRLARAYSADAVDALVAAGYLNGDEVAASAIERALRDASDLQLAEEIYRRAAAGDAGDELTEPVVAVVRNVSVVTGEDLEADPESGRSGVASRGGVPRPRGGRR